MDHPSAPLSSPGTISVEQISVPTAAVVLADSLREKILGGDLREGAELPSEREIGEQAAVSRATVREALRILQSEGLIEIRLGRRGGSSVLRPNTSAIERSVGIYIRGQKIRMDAVLETRGAIEPAAARYAALHRTEEDLAELDRCHQRLEQATVEGDYSAYVQANLDWHVQVVRASHNELLIAFISAVAKPVYLESEVEGFSSSEVRDAVVRAHLRVMEAIRQGDGEAAARRMARHVDAYMDGLRAAKAPVSLADAAARRRRR